MIVMWNDCWRIFLSETNFNYLDILPLKQSKCVLISASCIFWILTFSSEDVLPSKSVIYFRNSHQTEIYFSPFLNIRKQIECVTRICERTFLLPWKEIKHLVTSLFVSHIYLFLILDEHLLQNILMASFRFYYLKTWISRKPIPHEKLNICDF